MRYVTNRVQSIRSKTRNVTNGQANKHGTARMNALYIFADNGPQVLLRVFQLFAAATLNRRFQFLLMQGEIRTNY